MLEIAANAFGFLKIFLKNSQPRSRKPKNTRERSRDHIQLKTVLKYTTFNYITNRFTVQV